MYVQSMKQTLKTNIPMLKTMQDILGQKDKLGLSVLSVHGSFLMWKSITVKKKGYQVCLFYRANFNSQLQIQLDISLNRLCKISKYSFNKKKKKSKES